LAILDFEPSNNIIDNTISPACDVFWDEWNDFDVTSNIKVYGYPGERTKRGDPYEMIGTANGVHKGIHGSLLTYKNIDATPGQSGGPVLVQRVDKWAIVGVHVGTVNNHSYNVCTLLSDDIFNWAKQILSVSM